MRVAGSRRKAAEQPGRPAENRDGELRPIGAIIAMSAHDRHAITTRCRLQSLENLRARFRPSAPQRIDDRQRPSAHGVDVADVDHHAAIAGEPRRSADEILDEALDREQQIAVAIRDGGAIITDRHRRHGMIGTLKHAQDFGDVALVQEATAAPQGVA
jgi:hypothetical protein